MNKFFDIFVGLNTAIRTILIVGVLAFAALAISDYHTRTDMTTYIEGYNAYKKQATSGVKYSDSLKTIIAAYEKSSVKTQLIANAYAKKADSIAKVRPKPEVVKALQNTVDSLKAAVTDSMEMARTIIPAQAELIDTLNVTVSNQTAELSAKSGEIINLHVMVRNDSVVKRLMGRSIDSLKKVVLNLPPAPKDPDKFLGIKLPSRKIMGIGGFLIGVATDLYFRR